MYICVRQICRARKPAPASQKLVCMYSAVGWVPVGNRSARRGYISTYAVGDGKGGRTTTSACRRFSRSGRGLLRSISTPYIGENRTHVNCPSTRHTRPRRWARGEWLSVAVAAVGAVAASAEVRRQCVCVCASWVLRRIGTNAAARGAGPPAAALLSRQGAGVGCALSRGDITAPENLEGGRGVRERRACLPGSWWGFALSSAEHIALCCLTRC